jgi:hypothetical protein
MEATLLTRTLRLLPLVAATALLVGCGGSGGGSSVPTPARGAVRLSVAWPAQGRASSEARSVLVTVAVDGRTVGQAVMDRPQGAEGGATVERAFGDLPAGALATTATAYEEGGAQGAALGTGEAAARLEGGTTLLQTATPGADTAVTTTGKERGTGGLVVGVH